MTTLILGLGYSYYNDIRCSPIDPELYRNKPFIGVDLICAADIRYDLYHSCDYRYNKKGDMYNKYGYWYWKFAEDNSYEIIIDTIGQCAFWNRNKKCYNNQDELLKTICRVLKPNGIFYSYNGIYMKKDDKTLYFEAKECNGYYSIEINKQNIIEYTIKTDLELKEIDETNYRTKKIKPRYKIKYYDKNDWE